MSCDETDKQLDEIIAYYKSKKNAFSQESLVSLLREVQELLDCIPLHVQEEISQALCIKPPVISRLIKLYPSLTISPSRHRIILCLGPRCSQKDAHNLLNKIRKAICGKPFYITTQNCLKQCSTAPNMRIGNDLYSSIQEKDINRIINDYLEKARI